MLNRETQRGVEAAFDAALIQTRAPFQCVLAQSSATYALIPVLGAALAALATPWALLVLTDMAPERIYLIQLAVFALLLAAIAWTPVRVALASSAHKRSAGHRAALTQFALRGLDRSPERNGVLLYVSVCERYARIVADVGLDALVTQQEWRAVIEALGAAMRRGEREAALGSAASTVGALLARHFPAPEGGVKRNDQCFHIVR